MAGVSFETFDRIYESAETFEEVYGRIAGEVVEKSMAGDVVYCVPGHPLIGEESVRLILDRAKQAGIEFRMRRFREFHRGCARSRSRGLGQGTEDHRCFLSSRGPRGSAIPNLFYQVYDQATASELKLALMEVYPAEFAVYLVSGAGTDDERVEKLPLSSSTGARAIT